MMREVFIVADNIISPLGFTTEKNFYNLKQNHSAIKRHAIHGLSAEPFYASLLSEEQNRNLNGIGVNANLTKFEKLLIHSICEAVKHTDIDLTKAETVIIISTTKGNISLLETEANSPRLSERIALHGSARVVAEHFKNPNKPIVVSNACISGLTAMLTGKRLIESGKFRNAVVVGADVISKFILSGFQSFQAVSDKPCRPFDASRNGVTLGEAAATVILSSTSNGNQKVKFLSGAISNDANHISGPSRTGEELCIAVNKSLSQAGLESHEIAFVSAHGTATIYNDEMEAKAFSLANLGAIPVNSLKGYYGHTLGAAGIVESIISMCALQNDIVLPTAGFERSGVTSSINICDRLQPVKGSAVLKTASGFGGCNAALVFQKSYS